MTAASFGSLVLAARAPTGWVYLGNVGTGFTAAARRQLRQRLDTLAVGVSPFESAPQRRELRAARWVRAELVATIEYREYTGAGLRHPSWRGLRNDISPEDVRLPE
ncbi:hypothetical protein IU459_36080 [Nocardia amamiensis]|uniref:DNA ligase (ATP) n=1 Tax=Nocardia amamiensis TaxID=404578 RepID=A0ABS0D4G9_9NOCA|nr:hypothetical protein [Nocardia amamiensis]MBF6302897.1 hypothetical protein [Nocardia amamiensis]